MALRDRVVKVLITGDASGFKKAVGDVEKSASGLSGKMKGALAGIGVAAIGKGLLNAANGFKESALAARDFATTSGLAADQASRLLEVSSDLGVDSKQVATAVGRLSKNLATSQDKFAKLGVTVKKTANGQVDLKATFLDAIDVIKNTQDPLKKAQIGAELFGKSWQDLAPLIDAGAQQLAADMNAVGNAQVWTDKKIKKGVEYQKMQENLKDVTGALQVQLAQGLIPVLNGLMGIMTTLGPTGMTVVASLAAIGFTVGKVSGLVTSMHGAFAAFSNASAGMKFAGLLGALGALIAAEVVIINHQKEIEGWFARNVGGWKLWEHIPGMGGERANFTPVELKGSRALGGPVSANSAYLVGENGPEIFQPSQSGQIVPNSAGGAVVQQMVVNVYGETDYRKVRVMLERELARINRGGKVAVA